ncbi:hypothetical protein B7494_g6805 [Chlorociboria aeruginascens]|nr:hypothetical protein B7494_g6805 [Chlorociboria aeruginascens]
MELGPDKGTQKEEEEVQLEQPEPEKGTQEEDTRPINTETNATAVYEVVPASPTYFSINSRAYGIQSDSELMPSIYRTELSPKYIFKAFTMEPNLRGLISIQGQIERDTSAVDNPTHQPIYIFYLEIDLANVIDMTYDKPRTWSENAFPDAEEFGLLTMTCQSIRMSNGSVPTLKNAAAEERLRLQNNAIASGNDKLTFQFLLEYVTLDNNPDVLSTVLDYKWHADSASDPMELWIKDSKVKRQLLIGNIFSPLERAGLSEDNLVLALRRTHADSLEFKVFTIYSLAIENLFTESIAVTIATKTMPTAITHVPGSAFATNAHDNNLPNLYRLSVRWAQDVEKPKVGDKFEIVVPFDVGPCPPWTGPPVVRAVPQFSDDFEDDVEIITRQTAGKEDDAFSKILEDKQERRKVWAVYFWGSDELTVPGEITMWADSLWEGPPELSPTVPTQIPVHERDFHTKSRYIEIVKSQAQRHPLIFKLVSSNRTFKDMVRCINSFTTLEEVSNPTNTAQHLLKLMISGDLLRNPFRTRNMLTVTDSSLFTRLTLNLTEYQRDRLIQTLSRVEHGVVLIKGCSAAAKTVMLEISALLLNSYKEVARTQSLFVTDANAGVNDIASRLARRATQAGMTDLLIIRLHSIDGEVSRFIAKYIHGFGSARPRLHALQDGTSVATAIDDLASKHEKHKVDKRYDQNIVNLDLNAALVHFLSTNPNDNLVAILRTKMLLFSQNAKPDDMTVIKSLVKSLIDKILDIANIVITTCSLAIQDSISSRFYPRYIFKDEDCRSWPHYFYSLAGAYNFSVDTFFIAGDPIQKNPYIPSNISRNGVNPLVRELGYMAFQRFEDMGIKVYPFYEQHRMNNQAFVKYISEHHYTNAMVDGTLDRPAPPQVDFMRRFHLEHYGIDSNVAILVSRESHSQQVEGGTSLFNDAHAEIAQRYMAQLRSALQSADFPASSLSVLYLSTYLAQVANVAQRIQQNAFDAEAKTLEVSQGFRSDRRSIQPLASTSQPDRAPGAQPDTDRCRSCHCPDRSRAGEKEDLRRPKDHRTKGEGSGIGRHDPAICNCHTRCRIHQQSSDIPGRGKTPTRTLVTRTSPQDAAGLDQERVYVRWPIGDHLIGRDVPSYEGDIDPRQSLGSNASVLQGGVVIRDILNHKLTAIAGAKRDCLVADTSFQYGYAIIVTAECLEPETYNFRGKYRLFTDQRTRHIYGVYSMALKHNWVTEVDMTESKQCKVCSSAGHLPASCPEHGACLNCGSLEHKNKDCDAGFQTQVQVIQRKSDNRSCRHCNETGHLMADCPHPWCRNCKSIDHSYERCPHAKCKKCHVTGHWPNDPNCPNVASTLPPEIQHILRPMEESIKPDADAAVATKNAGDGENVTFVIVASITKD